MEALLQVMAAKKREILTVQEKKQKKKEKYLRRDEVELLLDEKKEVENVNEETSEKKKKRKVEHKTSERFRNTLEMTEDHRNIKIKEEEEEEADKILSWPDMRRRLRELGEPITLFGETMKDRMTRLRRVEMDVATKHDDELGAGHDIRNRFIGGDGEDQREKADDAAEDAEEFETSSDNRERKMTKVKKMMKNQEHKESREEKDEEEEKDTDKMVYRFFKGMLQRWENDLANRPDHVKRTAQGKIAVKTMKQCKDYIRPLFKLCKKRQVPSDILPKLVDIVKFCRQGEFVMANDAYIKLAIGNAAWPIGVTMVGIHERTGREKINSNKQAHVMNNESQRKYLTSVKRLMSYAQSVSTVLPSKRVL